MKADTAAVAYEMAPLWRSHLYDLIFFNIQLICSLNGLIQLKFSQAKPAS